MPKRVIEFLRHHFREHLARTSQSIRSIANEIEIDYLRLYRFQADELPRGLTYFEAKKIAKFLQPAGWEKELAEAYPAETHDFQSAGDTPTVQQTGAFRAVTKSPAATEVYLFVAEGLDVRVEDISHEFGSRGLQVLEELVKYEAVVRDSRGILKSGISADGAYPDDEVQALYRNYDEITDRDSPGHLVRLFARGLNKAGLDHVYGILSETTGALVAAYSNPAYSGSQIYLAALQCGLMQSQKREITK